MKKSNSVFLDVDPSIIEKNLLLVDNPEEDELHQMLNSQSKLVKPTPGFCVKTKELATDKKIFINICTTDAIPAPKDITEEELEDIIETEDVVRFKVPMSIGEIREEKDKKDQQAKACDIAIHPAFFQKIQSRPLFKNFFMTIVFQGLNNKYNLVCHDEKIILNNRKAFGTLQAHRIQQREIQKTLGEDVDGRDLLRKLEGQEVEKPTKKLIETISSVDSKEPEYVLYKTKGNNCLIGEFSFPDVISSNELTLDVGEDRILLECQKKGYFLDIFIPYIIRQKTCTSTFEKTTKVLTVTMPLVGG